MQKIVIFYGSSAVNTELEGQFVGLPLDKESQACQTNDRINSWIEQLKVEYK